MSDNPSPILTLITQQIIEVYRPIIKATAEALQKVTEVLKGIQETCEETSEREKSRAYEHLITPPHDHIHAHVTHTRTKPVSPARIYRRRTP